MAAAIAANPDMPVPTAATSVHPDPPPEPSATEITVVTVGAEWTGLFAGAAAGANPVEGDGRAAIVAECAPVRAVRDGRKACGFLYRPAVSADCREREHRQGTVDTDPFAYSYRYAKTHRS
jgi:hypothetical protein